MDDLTREIDSLYSKTDLIFKEMQNDYPHFDVHNYALRQNRNSKCKSVSCYFLYIPTNFMLMLVCISSVAKLFDWYSTWYLIDKNTIENIALLLMINKFLI